MSAFIKRSTRTSAARGLGGVLLAEGDWPNRYEVVSSTMAKSFRLIGGRTAIADLPAECFEASR